MVTEVKQTVYKTVDGNLFFDKGAANLHELKLELYALAKKKSWGKGGNWDEDMFIESLIENKEKIAKIFYPYLYVRGIKS